MRVGSAPDCARGRARLVQVQAAQAVSMAPAAEGAM